MSSLAHALPTRELVLERYRAVRPLGSGGSGSVWLAKDERTGLDVALKIVPREGKAAARAEREALAAKRLRHDRCVRAYDVGHDGGHVYIAYEYIPGRTLREALRADAVSDRDAVETSAQALDALAHAHRMGIVHRDVKPSNILLEDGQELGIRLLDFGLAQFDGADTLTAVGDVPGTLAYISPERLGGDEATPASDVWAVGVVLWEALAGQHPFWGMPLQEVATAIERGAPPLQTLRPDLPRRLLAAVDSALSLEPAARPHASVLAAELRAALRPARARSAPHPPHELAASKVPVARLVARVAPILLAGAAAALGVTLLPFWPASLAVAIVGAAAASASVSPRLGLAVALAAPVFPLGNVSDGAALLYGAFAVAWLALVWTEARFGLLFVAGPLLGSLGGLALVPLLAQPVRAPLRRAAQAALGVLSAGLIAVFAGDRLLPGGPARPPDVGPGDSAAEIVASLGSALAASPLLVVAVLLTSVAAAVLPTARRLSRFGVAGVGGVLVACAIASGTRVATCFLLVVVWAGAAVLAARAPR